MAIRRCPYCKAIIDESQKYCNNCGTQLLFPEDEFVEEDIKGEKIVDEDFKDSAEEFEESLEPSGEKEDQREEIDLEEVLGSGAAFPGEDDEEEKEEEAEERVEEEISEEKPVEKPKIKPATVPLPAAPIPAAPVAAPPPVKVEPAKPAPVKVEPDRPEPVKPEPAKPAPPKAEPIKPAPPKPAPAKAEEPVEQKPRKKGRPQPVVMAPVVGEREVQAIVADEPPDDVEAPLDEDFESDEEDDNKSDPDTREEIVRLIAALEKKQKKLSLTRDEEKLLAPLEEASSLPPWADLSKSNASTEIVDEDAEEKAEAQSYAPGDTMDFEEEVMSRAEKIAPTRSTIGIPEKVTKDKSGFLFDKKDMAKVKTDEIDIPRYEMEEADEDVYVAGEEPDEAEAAEIPRMRLGFFGRLTAFVFDLIFIALVWMGTVWGASLMMDVPVRALVKAVPIPLGGLFLILLAGYFFLFFFFLGETLGGRMASPRD